MKIQIERNGLQTWCEMPCTDKMMLKTLAHIGVNDPFDTKFLLVGVDADFEVLAPLVGTECDIDHINLLGRFLCGFCGSEYDQFMAAVEYVGMTDLTEIINMTQNIRNYTLVKPTDSLKTIGMEHYLNVNGSYRTADEETLNFPQMAQDLLASGKGVKTKHGLVFENGMEPWLVFNGHNIPCYYDSADFVLNCRISYNGADEYLFLPCDEVAIDKALHRLCVSENVGICSDLQLWEVLEARQEQNMETMM